MRVTFTNGPIGRDETLVEFSGTVEELRALVSALEPSTEDIKAKRDEEYKSLWAQRPIAAIKLHREHTGAMLKESKDYLEALCGKFVPRGEL